MKHYNIYSLLGVWTVCKFTTVPKSKSLLEIVNTYKIIMLYIISKH